MTEWYDFGIFAFLVPTISQVFFPRGSSGSLIATFAIFAASFVVRPLGGLFFGPLGDRIGRRRVLAITIIPLLSEQFLTPHDADEAADDARTHPGGIAGLLARVGAWLDALAVRYEQALAVAQRAPRLPGRARGSGTRQPVGHVGTARRVTLFE